MYSTLHAHSQSNFPASYSNSAPIRNEAYIATSHQIMDFVASDPNIDSSASGHSNSPDIDFNVQLLEDATAYSQDFPNLLPLFFSLISSFSQIMLWCSPLVQPCMTLIPYMRHG
jgi:hypothetical protein